MPEKMVEIEHRPGEELVIRLRPPTVKLMPEDARRHVKNAERQFLLGVRSLIDVAIEYIDKTEKPKGESRTKIEVQ